MTRILFFKFFVCYCHQLKGFLLFFVFGLCELFFVTSKFSSANFLDCHFFFFFFACSKLDDPDCGTLDDRYFRTHTTVARSPNYINMREVCDHHTLPPGDYMVIPTTFEPNQEADFILRVYSEKPDEVK